MSIGASIGASKGEGGTDHVTARGVLARLHLSPRFSIEAELDAVTLHNSGDAIAFDNSLALCAESPCEWSDVAATGRFARGTLRYDLSTGKTVTPHLLVGGGIEQWDKDFMTFVYARRELGGGIDLRLTEGLRIGADVRVGRRELVGQRSRGDVTLDIYIAPPLPEAATPYTTARLTVTAAF